ncbi:MAG: TonB-dependent receptor domain-containing protein, partial [bacterium]
GIFNNNSWNETVFKFSVGLTGYRDYLSFNSYLNFGTNVKFPTLFQQISSPLRLTSERFQPNLNPEKSRSVEIGFSVTKEFRGRPALYGWGISGIFFQNHYDNKFRLSATPGVPVNFYDNVQNARISGFETKSSLYLYRKKLTLQYALAKYNISEKAAFPFKSDIKHTFDILVDHAGYSFQIHWFKEGEQVGWLRLTSSGTIPEPSFTGFGEITLPDYSNLDVHLSKKFGIGKLKLFLNFSGRNLLNSEDVILEGLAIRDRRFYVTMGAQY